MGDPRDMAEEFGKVFQRQLRIEQDLAPAFEEFYLPLAHAVRDAQAASGRMLRVGVCGAQGSGKTTLTMFLDFILTRLGLAVAVLSIDDLYLTWDERRRQRRELGANPYYRVSRGNPGTHDVAMGVELIDRLAKATSESINALPVFDKAAFDGKGDRRPLGDWPRFRGRPDVFILEGWCVGMRRMDPQTMARLLRNVPEAVAFAERHDPTGRYGQEVNERLATYEPLFDRLDKLVFLKIPSLTHVLDWRTKQERQLREKVGRGMSDEQVREFIEPYMLLTGVHGLQVLGDPEAGAAEIILEIGENQLPRRRLDCSATRPAR